MPTDTVLADYGVGRLSAFTERSVGQRKIWLD